MVFAYVTLLLNSGYLPGTLTLAKSLQETKSEIPLVLLFSKNNINTSVFELIVNCGFFHRLINVDEYLIKSNNEFQLVDLLKRKDLMYTLTKLNIWRLVDYDKVVYLDSDILVQQNIDNLFDYVPEMSEYQILAASDSGWPDIFNSGLFVIKPSVDVFNQLMQFYNSHDSFDGADQGLLNEFFNLQSDKTAGLWCRLPFTYNCTLNSNYEYLPAMIRFKDDIKVFHFIGMNKPWKNHNLCFDPVYARIFNNETTNLYQLWWDKFNSINLDNVDNVEILEIAGQLQTRLDIDTLTISTPTSDEPTQTADEPVNHHFEEKAVNHRHNEINNPFLSPQTEQIENLHFPTFYYKKPSTEPIKDESGKGEAWKMCESKVEWSDEKGNDPEDGRTTVLESPATLVQEEPLSQVDRYIQSHPIFPWEEKHFPVTRTFSSATKFEPPKYNISIAEDNSDPSEEEEYDECIDGRLLGFDNGDRFEEYINKVNLKTIEKVQESEKELEIENEMENEIEEVVDVNEEGLELSKEDARVIEDLENEENNIIGQT